MSTQTVLETPVRTAFSVGRLTDVPLGMGRCFFVMGEEVAVFRQRDGRVFAVQNRCPHKNGPLAEGLTGDGKVVCPLHAQKFDLSTGEGCGSDHRLKTYAVKIVDGEILIFPPA